MRGDDPRVPSMWSYRTPEMRVPQDHPLRPIRTMVERALAGSGLKLHMSGTGKP